MTLTGQESARQGLLDTSVFIAKETGRALGELPDPAAVSVVTLAELHLRVLMAHGSAVRARRLRTLTMVQNTFEPLPIDSEVARTFAELVAEAERHGTRPKIMNTWTAATAGAQDIPVYTQDEGFAEIAKVRIHRV
ncbi:MAG: PIN domain-containing protein [Deltaproteobacteria bacterium]|nr:PIN domain-containing protein [Deltaproteobacteria bacterium]